jgi:hypothetical protein
MKKVVWRWKQIQAFVSAKRLVKVRRRQAAALYWTLGRTDPHPNLAPAPTTRYETISSHSWSSPLRFTILHRGVDIAFFCS